MTLSNLTFFEMNEHHLKTLKELSKDSTLSQRDLSKKLGLSLGRVNYVLNAPLDKGLVKAERFKNSKNKLAYMYNLTPEGIDNREGGTDISSKKKHLDADLHRFALIIQRLKQKQIFTFWVTTIFYVSICFICVYPLRLEAPTFGYLRPIA